MELINGKEIADKVLADLKEKVEKSEFNPGLAVVLVGEDRASQIYVNLKEEAANEAGINFEKFLFDENASEEEVIEKIKELNNDERFHGIIVQLPLPKKFNTDKIINTISREKDADGFREDSGNRNPVFPTAIIKMIESVDKKIKSAVIITKSDRFGKEMINQLDKKEIDGDYKLCEEVSNVDFNNYDAIITACGMPGLISSDMVQSGAVIIDGGIKKENEKVLGDIDIKSFKNTNSHISPVPGGVGPVTVSCLLESVCKLAKIDE